MTVVVVATFSGALGFGVSPAAAASEQCDATIIDGAQKFGSDLSAVEASARSLATLGTDVRVRTLPNLGSFSTLDGYIDSMKSECGSWRSTSGTRKNNLLVFAMAVNDRKVGIFYGEQWKQAFKDAGGEGRIYNNQMGPRFADGDFAGGFVAGMNESFRVIDKFLKPDKAASNSGPAVIVDKKPTDLSGLWIVLGIMVGLLALGGLLYFGNKVLTKRREDEEGRKTERQRALRARDATTNITNQVGDTKRKAVRQAKVAKYSQIGGTIAQRLAQAQQTVDTNLEAAIGAVASASSASGSEEDTTLTAGEYEQIANSYEGALEYATKAQQADRLIDELAASVEADLQRVSQGILTTQAGIDQANGSLQALKDEGIKADDIDGHVAASEAALTLAKENQTDLSALQHLDAANGALSEANDAIKLLAEQRQQLARDIPVFAARIGQVESLIEPAHAAFNRVSGTYANSSWESVQGNGSEAEKSIAAARRALAASKEQSAVDQQQWFRSISSLQEGNLALDRAQSLLHSVTELESNLQTAQEQAPKVVHAVQLDIDKAAAYIADHDDDVSEKLESDLVQAQEVLRQAQVELDKERPDFLLVMKLVTQADSMADGVFKNAQSEREAAQRLRQQAASMLTQAHSEVSRAAEFIQDHSSDVTTSAETSLRTAKEALRQAQSHSDHAKILASATSALQHADSAYRRAKRDFSSAEDERRAQARRRREAEERRERERRDERDRASHSTLIVSDWGNSHSNRGSDIGGSSAGWGGGGDGGGSSGGW